MVILVSGGAASGKSEFAEDLAQRLFAEQADLAKDPAQRLFAEQAEEQGGSLIYLATMNGSGEEAKKRIEKHRSMRKGKGFKTVELTPAVFREISGRREGRFEGSVVLLEDLSNLLSELMFPPAPEIDKAAQVSEEKGDSAVTPSYEEVGTQVERILGSLSERSSHLVIVTNEVFSDGSIYDPGTTAFIQMLGEWNQRIAAKAEMVFEVVAGLPLLKGGRSRDAD